MASAVCSLVCLTYLGTLRLIPVQAQSRSSAFSLTLESSVVYICDSACVHSSAGGHLGCFKFGATLNKAAQNILRRGFWWAYALFSVGPCSQECRTAHGEATRDTAMQVSGVTVPICSLSSRAELFAPVPDVASLSIPAVLACLLLQLAF